MQLMHERKRSTRYIRYSIGIFLGHSVYIRRPFSFLTNNQPNSFGGSYKHFFRPDGFITPIDKRETLFYSLWLKWNKSINNEFFLSGYSGSPSSDMLLFFTSSRLICLAFRDMTVFFEFLRCRYDLLRASSTCRIDGKYCFATFFF